MAILPFIFTQGFRGLIDWLRPCQHDNGHMDGRSQTKVHTNERTQVHSAQFSLVVTHPSTNQARRYLTSVTESPSNVESTSDILVGDQPTRMSDVDSTKDIREQLTNR